MTAFLAIVRASFLQRVRSSAFLFALAPPAYLAWSVQAGYWSMRHDSYRAAPSLAYAATMSALLAGMLLSLVGFYLVKNAVDLDRRTGVGPILAATPLSSWAYLSGKAFSNFMVLASMTAILAIAALWMGLRTPGASWFEASAVLAPFVLIALPILAVTAALAVVFEALPGLRGGLGNVVWFFAWGAGIVALSHPGNAALDLSGMTVVRDSLLASLQEAYPGATATTMSISAEIGENARHYQAFPWGGVGWQAPWLWSRVAWLGVAAILVRVAAFPFDRFDSGGLSPGAREHPSGGRVGTTPGESTRPIHAIAAEWRAIDGRGSHAASTLLRLIVIELRLLLAGQPWLWYAGVLGLIVAQIAAPIDAVRRVVLPLTWIWPLLVWSRMGARDRLFGTESLVDSAPSPALRLVPAAWVAGLVVALGTAAPAFLRIALSGDAQGFFTSLAAAAFIPALALACGTLSGGSRLFEALYLMLWYVGPLNHVPALDFIGTTVQPSADHGGRVAAAALLLFVTALVARTRRARS
jgi:hypothetical protein